MTVERKNFYIDYDITDPSRVFYEFSFPVKEPNQISCYDIIPHDDTADEIEQIPDGYFTVASDPTPEGYENGGSITLTPGFVLEEGHILRISRRTPKTQAKVFENQNRIWPEEIEDALDRLIMILQEMNADEVQTIINQMEGDIGSIFATIAQFAHHAGRHSTGGEDPVTPASIGAMPEPPADGKKYIGTKNGTAAAKWDILDANFVEYDADGNLTFQAGMDMRTSIPQPNDPSGNPVAPVVRTVLDTDSNGNFIVGNQDGELNFQASVRPTTEIAGGAIEENAFLSDLTPYAPLASPNLTGVPTAPTAADGTSMSQIANTQFVETAKNAAIDSSEAYTDASVALKADLVGGKIPTSQMPPGAIPNNFTVTNESDLVTLTAAIPNDRAKVTSTDEIWLLWTLPATDINSWENITSLGSGGGGGGRDVLSVNGMKGAVTIDLPQLSGVQSALDDKADAADLAAYAPINNPNLTGTVQVPTAATGENSLRAANTGWVTSKLASYAPINSPALTGTPTAPTPPASATGGEIMTAAAVNTKLTSNLANTAPSMVRTDGVSTAGSAATVSRSDHEHGIVKATAATATAAGAAGSVVYAADNDTTSRDKAVTPAGLAAELSTISNADISLKGTITTRSNTTINNIIPFKPVYLITTYTGYGLDIYGKIISGSIQKIFGLSGSVSFYGSSSMVIIPNSGTLVIKPDVAVSSSVPLYVYQ